MVMTQVVWATGHCKQINAVCFCVGCGSRRGGRWLASSSLLGLHARMRVAADITMFQVSGSNLQLATEIFSDFLDYFLICAVDARKHIISRGVQHLLNTL